MKKLIQIAFFIFFIISSSCFSVNSSSKNIYINQIGEYDLPEPIVIRVGVVRSSFFTMNCSVGKDAFDGELDNYCWTVGNQRYIINLTEISRKQGSLIYISDLLNYNKLKKNYDVLIISGIQDEQILGGLPFTKDSIRMKLLIRNLERFVREGGGLIGHCGGSTIPIKSAYDDTRTLSEYILYKGSFKGTNTKIYCHTGMPILSEHLYTERIRNPEQWLKYTPHPEYMGYLGYLYYNRMESPCGIPMNLDIRESSHPIFRGYHDDKILIRWGAGPSYINPIGNLNVTNLADYPYDEDPYVNKSTRINYWTFNEKIPMIKALISSAIGLRFFPILSELLINFNKNWDTLWHMQDWDKTDIPIITDHGNHSALVSFNYPEGDPDAGRILLCGCHPELCVWERKGNYIKQVEDVYNNTMFEGLIYWMNDSGTPENPNDDKMLQEDDYIIDPLKWFVRREVAWACKNIDFDSYPPIYGRSKVIEITPKLKDSDPFNIKCSVGKETDETWHTTNLSLYYRYNGTNSSHQWTDFRLYNSVYSEPWEFLFDSKNAFGDGIYEFYSILNTTNNSKITCDNIPPKADTICYVGEDIVADFDFKPGTAYPNYKVYFESSAITKSGTNIIEFIWDFGDGNSSNQEKPVHVYSEIGTYDVKLTVKNNDLKTDIIIKQIKVISVPKHADLE